MKPLVLLALFFNGILPLYGQDAELNNAFTTIQSRLNNLPRFSIHYTSANAYPSTHSGINRPNNDTVECWLKISGSRFYFEEIGSANSDPNINFHYTLAFDGKKYQVLNKYGDLIIGSSPDFLHPEQLATTPLVEPFFFALPAVYDNLNPFEVLRNPTTWITLLKSSKSTNNQLVKGKKTVSLIVSNADRQYEVKLRSDLGYFPTYWRKNNSEGMPITFECSLFHNYPINNGLSLIFPSKLSETLANKQGDTISSTLIKVIDVQPISSDSSDNATFQIPSSSARSIYDNDVGEFLK